MDRQADGQTDRLTDRQTDRQTDRWEKKRDRTGEIYNCFIQTLPEHYQSIIACFSGTV
jgi:hypothetical protein